MYESVNATVGRFPRLKHAFNASKRSLRSVFTPFLRSPNQAEGPAMTVSHALELW